MTSEAEELTVSMKRTAANLLKLGDERGLDPRYAREVVDAAFEEDSTRFIEGVGYFVAALIALREERSKAA